MSPRGYAPRMPETRADRGAAAPAGGLQLDELVDVFGTIDRWIRAEGPVVRREGRDGHAVFVLAERAAAEHLLRAGGGWEKGWGMDRVRLLLGRGLMVLEGAEWTRHRRVVQPRFHRDALQAMAPMVEARAAALAASWREAVGPVEIVGSTARFAVGTILDLVFGPDTVADRALEGAEGFGLLAEGGRDLAFARRYRERRSLLAELVAARRATPPGADILGHLVRSPLSDAEIVDELATLLVAGSETTAAALAWTWILLASHPHVEAELAAGRMDADVVIEEALRLWPPGWLLTRRAVADDTLAGHPVRAGDHALVSLYHLHRHALPDGFAPGTPALPFGAGPRACVGDVLARMELRAAVSAAVAAVRVASPPPPVTLDAGVNLRPRGRVWIGFSPRGADPLRGAADRL